MMWFFIAGYAWLTAFKWFHIITQHVVPFHFVTNILLYVTLFTLGFLQFKKTRFFTIKHLLFPWVIFSWIVIVARLSFNVLDGMQWIDRFAIAYHPHFSLPLLKISDFFLHIVPLFLGLHYYYVYRREIISAHQLSHIFKAIGYILSPYLIIIIWDIFHNPYSTYMVPYNSFTLLAMYVGIPLFSFLISFVIYPEIFKITPTTNNQTLPMVGIVVAAVACGIIFTSKVNIFNILMVLLSCIMIVFVSYLFNNKWGKKSAFFILLSAFLFIIIREFFLITQLPQVFISFFDLKVLIENPTLSFIFITGITPILFCTYFSQSPR